MARLPCGWTNYAPTVRKWAFTLASFPHRAQCDSVMTFSSPDGSRDRRIEDPSNLWLIHPLARALLPRAVRSGVSANTVSVIGLVLGAGAASAFVRWPAVPAVLLGLLLAIAWMIADGLDGMIARATGTASALGRTLDGLCDHGVFVLIYVALALRIGTAEGWFLAIAAGAAHAVQSNLYEGERSRFHRRIKGVPSPAPVPSAGALVRFYDAVSRLPERLSAPFERALAATSDPQALGRLYGERAVPAMRLQSLLTANVRVGLITLACLVGDPRLFWAAEIGPLSLVALVGLLWHRRVERGLVQSTSFNGGALFASASTTREHS
jgi:CDP-diacylglycerol--serine O-phosphatidyltransferase